MAGGLSLATISSGRSAANSTTATLAGDEEFTGIGELNDATDVLVSLKADVDGTLYVEFSIDGTNWDTSIPFAVAGGTGEFHTLVKGTRHCRVRYVNGSAAQSYFRMQTEFGNFRQPNSPLKGTIQGDADALIVRSVSAELDLALGRFGGMIEATQFGHVTGLDAADSPVDIWAFGHDTGSPRANTKTFKTSAATLYIASDSAADTSKVFTAAVILADGSESEIEVTTDASDGRTPVSLGVSGLDVNACRLTGDNQSHAGNIYIQQGNAFTAGVPDDVTDVVAFIEAGQGKSEAAGFRVPTGKIRRIKRAIISISRANGTAGSATIHLRVKRPGESWVVERDWEFQNGFVEKQVAGIVLAAGAWVMMRVDDVSDTDTNITGELIYEEVDV